MHTLIKELILALYCETAKGFSCNTLMKNLANS